MFQSDSQAQSKQRHESPSILSDCDEGALIQLIVDWLGNTNPPSPQGIGDDCALFPAQAEGDFLISTDSVVLDKHFDAELPARKAGAKLALRNLCDIAAMGGVPVNATLAILCGSRLEIEWLAEFYKGIRSVAENYALQVVGGDLCQLPGDQFQAVMTIIGRAENPVLRHRAGLGDSIYVTGQLGGSITEKHYHFRPHLSAGQWLAKNNYASSMVDSTDGLAKELHFLLAKGQAASIDLKAIPISEAAQVQSSGDPNKALEKAFCDGEDYELLFTLPHSVMSTDFESEWQKNFPQIQISRIGNIVEQRGSARLLNYCDQRPLHWDGGFDHFKQ